MGNRLAGASGYKKLRTVRHCRSAVPARGKHNFKLLAKNLRKWLQPARFIAHNAWRLWLFGNAPGNFIRRVRNEFWRALVICLFSAVPRRKLN